MGKLAADRIYAYDTLNRLLTAKLTDTQDWSAASVKTSWYNYDDLGNRISSVDRDAAAVGYQHDKANRMTQHAGQTQAYDKAGNLTLTYSPAGGNTTIIFSSCRQGGRGAVPLTAAALGCVIRSN
jgi:YD repeat-containing protein